MPFLNRDEQRRIQSSLRRRLRILDPGNFVDVGFGIGWKEGRADRNRTSCVCIFVRRKRARPRKTARFPREIAIRWYRGGTLQRATLATDVVEIPQIVPASFPYQFEHQQFVVGAEIAWRYRRSKAPRTGWLTVGHPFAGVTQRRRAWVEANGLRMIARSRRRSAFDAAILAPVADHSSAITEYNSEPWPVASLADLPSLTGTSGKSWLPGRPRSLQFQAYFPRFVVPRVGQLVNIVSAIASPGTFAPGSSGAVWLVGDTVATMQVAASSPSFSLGFGQAVASSLVWAEQALERRPDGRPLVGSVSVISL